MMIDLDLYAIDPVTGKYAIPIDRCLGNEPGGLKSNETNRYGAPPRIYWNHTFKDDGSTLGVTKQNKLYFKRSLGGGNRHDYSEICYIGTSAESDRVLFNLLVEMISRTNPSERAVFNRSLYLFKEFDRRYFRSANDITCYQKIFSDELERFVGLLLFGKDTSITEKQLNTKSAFIRNHATRLREMPIRTEQELRAAFDFSVLSAKDDLLPIAISVSKLRSSERYLKTSVSNFDNSYYEFLGRLYAAKVGSLTDALEKIPYPTERLTDRKTLRSCLELKLPLKTALYRNYLLTKTVKEIDLLAGNLTAGGSAKVAISISEKILTESGGEDPKERLMRLTVDAFHAVSSKMDSTHRSTLLELIKILADSKKVTGLEVLIAFFTSQDKKFIVKDAYNYVGVTAGTKTGYWCSPSKSSDYVLGLLLKDHTPEEVVYAVSEVAAIKPLTPNQWEWVLENADITTPASWWVTLAKRPS
jgi:hypothetical protein